MKMTEKKIKAITTRIAKLHLESSDYYEILKQLPPEDIDKIETAAYALCAEMSHWGETNGIYEG